MTNWNRRTFLRTAAQTAAITSLPIGGLAQKAMSTGFPKDFHWGASTAAMQVEGSPYADGGGRSIWAAFEAKPGNIKDGSTNWVADDEYHRYAEDIGHMSDLGINAYRFSIGWPRVLPQGKGQPNEAGLAYYDKLIDALLAAKITAIRHHLPLRLSRRAAAAGRMAEPGQFQVACRLCSSGCQPIFGPRHKLVHD